MPRWRLPTSSVRPNNKRTSGSANVDRSAAPKVCTSVSGRRPTGGSRWPVRVGALVFAAQLWSCDAEVPHPAATVGQAAIRGGQAASDEQSVFFLLAKKGTAVSAVCSGTLVGPQTLLLAAHCVYPFVHGDRPGEELWATNAAIVKPPFPNLIRVGTIRPHPAFVPRTSLPADRYAEAAVDDIALVKLEADPGVARMRWASNSQEVPDATGVVRAIGYGVANATEEAGSSRVRRSVSMLVREKKANVLALSGSTADVAISPGDSGGPSVVVGEDGMPIVVSLHSLGARYSSPSGPVTTDFDCRVDVYDAFVRSYLESFDPRCLRDDRRCDRGCLPADEDCRPLNASCDADEDCLDPALRCLLGEPASQKVCRPPCTQDAGCDSDRMCDVISGVCRASPVPTPSPSTTPEARLDGGEVVTPLRATGGCAAARGGGSGAPLDLLCAAVVLRAFRRQRGAAGWKTDRT